jgi:hypothetical protein
MSALAHFADSDCRFHVRSLSLSAIGRTGIAAAESLAERHRVAGLNARAEREKARVIIQSCQRAPDDIATPATDGGRLSDKRLGNYS